MPEGYAFSVNHRFWTPLRTRRTDDMRGARAAGPTIFAFGRLASDVTLEGAQAELTTLGLLPPVHALKNAGPKSSAERGERRLLSGVIMMQIALTLALLVGAELLMRTMYNLSEVSSGPEALASGTAHRVGSTTPRR